MYVPTNNYFRIIGDATKKLYIIRNIIEKSERVTTYAEGGGRVLLLHKFLRINQVVLLRKQKQCITNRLQKVLLDFLSFKFFNETKKI